MATTSKAARKKIAKVMREFGEGDLKSGSGHKVTDKKQAIAIALEVARDAGLKVPRRTPSGSTTPRTTTMRRKSTRTSKA
ncbi:MAG: hypothetical protein J0I17_09930 ['Candidatus Kapabacteria' thiocyanatum]|uniref:Uncharacterized protein n=1 Tax=Candidatus Kapaibacterium thiocyanatum TaxID=1895771 RepID=A0A1M3KVG2_9BACT|nr:hypothetical protein ['Candidatus Kapabacteria' thiocyanatum]OJX56251.1 MAG: hypothetical protein BGO89_13005 ['Candidatus Kapabacteria' thiocyanatum]